MATRLYFHAATDGTSGLPTTEQSSLTATVNIGSQADNHQMTTTIGASQTEISGITNNASAINVYFTKFVSPPLDQTSVAANTWTYNFSTMEDAIGCNFPVNGSGAIRVNCYVWRPSNQTTVGTILDGNTASNLSEPSADTQVAHHTTFTGAQVTGVQTNDVIIFEVWCAMDTSASGASEIVHWYYDGTTANTTNNATVSNHASFLETPENLTFSSQTTTVTQTSIHKYNLDQYVLQSSIHKYDLRQNVAQTSVQKYDITTTSTVTQTSIQKYDILQYVTPTSIHKYDLRQYIPQTSIHKYSLFQDIAQSSIHKYDLLNNILQTSVQKYDLFHYIAPTSIHKYDLRAYLAQTSIHKYDIQVTAGGPTRLYFHAATDGTSGLPTSAQAGNWFVDKMMEGNETTNHQMTTTIGTSQIAITETSGSISLSWNQYFTRFVSAPLTVTSISANTWTYNFASSQAHVDCNFPVNGTNKSVGICVYVWRPSTQTKIGTVRDGTTAATVDEAGAGTEAAHHVTFSGSAVTCQANDVLICEIWFNAPAGTSGAASQNISWYYDGTTANTTDNATVSSHASFIETPQDLFGTGTTTVSQTSIHKYNLLQNVAQTSVQKYDIQGPVSVLQTSVHKYDIRQNITQSSIHKYNLRTFVAITSLIQKYNLIQNILQTSIQKYNVVQIIGQTSLHKYNIGGRTIATSIHKYNIGLAGSIDMTNTNTKTYSNKFIQKT